MTKRIEYIDIMRGIAILLVVFEHCIGSMSNTTAAIVLSFHMPLFFFISGCCVKPLTSVVGGGKILIIKKVRTIFLPQVTLGFIGILSSIILDVLLKRSYPISEVDFITPFTTWFLPVLFIMELTMMPILALFKNRWAIMILAAMVFVVYYFTSYNDVCYVQQSIAALFFGLLGYASRPLLDKYNNSESKYKGFGWLSLLLVALLSTLNDPVGMYINQYGDKILFMLISLLGIYSILDISVSLRNTSFLQWCGRMSIIIYVWQFSLSRVSMAVVNQLPLDSCYAYILSFFICFALLLPITYLSNKYIYSLFGK